MVSNSRTNEKYWDSIFGDMGFFEFGFSNYQNFYNNYLISDPTKKCLEIGAFPGSNLGYLAKKFLFKPTALDFLDNIGFIEANMKYNGIENCKIIKEDFIHWEPVEKYDVVCSHGFVEHFENYEEIIKKHVQTLNQNGILFISVPYLKYFQLWIREVLYTKEKFDSIMKAHNLNIMNLKRLKGILVDLGLEILFAKYIRGMTIWFPANPETIQMEKIYIYNNLKLIEKVVNKFGISNRFISPEILIVAKNTG
jgi:2-polyprenyl-3-methyl-5-hydroxy-6-metoxy-1,4-benzoquinol methylase